MKRSWSVSVGLWVWEAGGCVALRAGLGRACDHPRAFLTLREGLALWSGAPRSAAISARGSVDRLLDVVAIDEQGWPEESTLVGFPLLACRSRSLDRGPRAKATGRQPQEGGS